MEGPSGTEAVPRIVAKDQSIHHFVDSYEEVDKTGSGAIKGILVAPTSLLDTPGSALAG